MGTVTVTMTFDANSITDVKVDVSEETANIGGVQGDHFADVILQAQGTEVDNVSGATITSKAIKTAADACIAQAKGESVQVKVDEEDNEEEALGEATVTYDADVVIAGAGAAGLMAALNLSRAGKKVIILECSANANSSNFSMCGGPAACETKIQKEENAWVSLDTLFTHMYKFTNTAVNGRLLRKVLACTGKAIDDMQDLGVPMYLWPDAYDNGFRARHFFMNGGEERVAPIVPVVVGATAPHSLPSTAKIRSSTLPALCASSMPAPSLEVLPNALAIGGEALVRQGRAYCVMDSDYYNGVLNEGIYAYLGSPAEWVAGQGADYYKTTPENAEAHLEQAISVSTPAIYRPSIGVLFSSKACREASTLIPPLVPHALGKTALLTMTAGRAVFVPIFRWCSNSTSYFTRFLRCMNCGWPKHLLRICDRRCHRWKDPAAF